MAVILAPAPGSTLDAGRVELSGRVSDARDDAEHLYAAWAAGGEDATDEAGWEPLCAGFAWADGTTLCVAELRPEHTRVRLRVVDVAGFVGVAEAAVEVVARATPTLTWASPSQGPWFANVDVPFELVVADADDEVTGVTVIVSSDLDGVLALPSPGADGMVSGGVLLREGVHRVVATATDPGGRTGRAEQVVVVEGEDAAPVVRLDPALVVSVPAATTSLRAWALDDHTAPEDLAAAVSVAGAVVWQGAPSADGEVVAAVVGAADGDLPFRVEVTDASGVVGVAEGTWRVDRPPALTVDQPVEGALLPVGAPVVVSLSAVDARTPGEVTVSVDSDRDGPRFTAAVDGEGRVERVVFLSPGAHRLTLRAVDADGLSVELTRQVEVVSP